MSDHVLDQRDDTRFHYPLSFVKKHVLGALEASRACCMLPGRRHLYHVAFEGRPQQFCEEVLSNMPLYPIDALLEAKFEPCDEVTWYLAAQRAKDTSQQSFAEISKDTSVDTFPTSRRGDPYTTGMTRAAELLATRPQCQPWCSAHSPHFGNCFIDKREETRRTDALPELSFKGTLGPAPAAYKNPEEVQ